MRPFPVTRFAHPVEVVDNQPLGTHFVCLSLKSQWVSSPFWLPGQYLMFDGEDQGRVVRKCFTPIAAGKQGFTVLIRRTGGWMNSRLCESRQGTILRMSGATGKQKLFSEDNQPVSCVAFDSGISFAISLAKHPGSPPMQLFWSAADGLMNDLTVISERFEIPIIPFDQYETILPGLSRQENRQIFLSGDGRMIANLESLLLKHGIDRACIRHEIYYNHRDYLPH